MRGLAGEGFLQRDFHVVAQVGATLATAATTALLAPQVGAILGAHTARPVDIDLDPLAQRSIVLAADGTNLAALHREQNRSVVPLDDIYVDANFKETQLRRLRPGQPVDISVDANKSEKIGGVVDSLAPASGSVFTLLPPDNATGNFTKIVQRVPVRIRIPADVAKQHLMRAGMSVYVTVDTRKDAKVEQ